MSRDGTPVLNVAVMMAASAVALKARHGGLTLHDVDDLRVKAEELLARGDPMRTPILAFASMYEVLRRDPQPLRELGEDLWRAIGYATAPGPTLPERRDIDG